MLKDDYIMRIIEQAAIVLGRVLRMIDERRFDEAEKDIEDALELYAGLDLEAIKRLSAEQLTASLRHREMGGAGELLMLAELIAAEADVVAARGDDDLAYDLRLKALELHLDLVIGHDLTHIPTDASIETLTVRLDDYVLPFSIVYKLFTYREKSGRYDSAEDTLYELLDEYVSEQDMAEEGLAFYERLLQKSDYELQSGGLPREEVLNGIEELWTR
jgi:hypothetical protein